MITDTAFPHQGMKIGDEWKSPSSGMSLRDYFAAAALQGLIAGRPTTRDGLLIAQESYKLADAMLAARNPRHEGE